MSSKYMHVVRAHPRPGTYHVLVLMELRWICRTGAQGDGSLLNALSRKCYMRCRWGDMQCHALSTQTTQNSPGAEPRRSKRKLRQIFGIKLNRQLILFQTHRLVAGTQTSEPNTIKPNPDLLEG